MNQRQRTAIESHCYFAFETAHPRFGWLETKAGVSIVLTVNSGWERLEANFGGPVWHASIAAHRLGVTMKQLRRVANRVLAGVGDPRHEWEEWTGKAFHKRRRLSEREQQQTGEPVDLRGTDEAKSRAVAMGTHLLRIPQDMLFEEVGPGAVLLK